MSIHFYRTVALVSLIGALTAYWARGQVDAHHNTAVQVDAVATWIDAYREREEAQSIMRALAEKAAMALPEPTPRPLDDAAVSL